MRAPIATRVRELLREPLKKIRREYFVRIWHMEIGEGSTISFSAKLDRTNPRGIYIGKYSVVAFGAAVLTHDWVNVTGVSGLTMAVTMATATPIQRQMRSPRPTDLCSNLSIRLLRRRSSFS